MIESTLKPANTPGKKQHWLIWILLVVVLGAAAVVIYFAQSGQFFKGAATLPASQGPIFYVVDEYSTGHCDIGDALLGSTNCPFEGLEEAYNHVKANPNINPVELRLASGNYLLQDLMEFENRRVNINGGYDSSSFSDQNLDTPSVLQSAIKVKNGSGKISNLIVFNGGRNDSYIEVDNSNSNSTSFEISNITASNVGFTSFIKVATGNGDNQAVIQNVNVFNSRAEDGAIIDVTGNGNVLIRNNYIASSYATPKGIISAEDNVKIVNNAIVDTPGGNDTGGIYTNGGVIIAGGADAKVVNNSFIDNAFNGPVVKQDSDEDDYMWINNNLVAGSRNMFNVPPLSAAAARGNVWSIQNTGPGITSPNYGINQTYNGPCDPKLKSDRNPYSPEDYKLPSDSTCIDMGIDASGVLNLSSPDYFGINRPVGDSADPGFSEYIVQFALLDLQLKPLIIDTDDDPGITSVLEGLRIPNITKEPFVFATCGDGNLDTTEECDDGNTVDGDGCSATCTLEETEECGNGILEGAEECDDGNTADGDGCSATCTEEQVTPTEECGNGILEGAEECDDGNTVDGDGCDNQCKEEVPEDACGNGILEAGEQCDDGNTVNEDGCDDQCQYEDPNQQTDLCSNLSGDQFSIPDGYFYNPNTDECEEIIADHCANISGVQDEIPEGYERIGVDCFEIEEEGVPCGEWTDVSDNDPEYDLWVWLCDRDILKGHNDGTLRPEDSLTRAELLALAFRASDYENEYEVDEDANYCFVDVDDEWFAQYACTAEDLGFVEGYVGNIFDPARTVILAEGLKMFLGALDEPITINRDPNKWYFDMLFDAEDDDYLPYTLTEPEVVGPIELTRRKAANMLYRIMIYR